MTLDGNSLVIVGVLAGILILSGWVQQIIKGYRTKSLKDVSRYLMSLIAVGAILWVVYGIALDDVYIILTNVAAVILMITVICMKYKYDKIN